MSQAAILGGPPVRYRRFADRKTMGEAEERAAVEVIRSDVLSDFLGAGGDYFLGGAKVRGFEDKWCEMYGFKHGISVNSWTSGLVIAMGAVGVQPGDEVICPPYTMSASATAAIFYGGIPVFADIERETLCLDPADFERKITPRTRAVVVVHLLGRSANMDAIMEIARRHDVKVIEDAAQAPGVRYKGRPVGAIGDVGGFSLNFHKHIHCGEGGMLVTQSDELARRCQLIRNHGENAVSPEEVASTPNFFGGNYRLTELQSAIGIAQLDRLEGYLEARQRLAAHMARRLDDMPGLQTYMTDEGDDHAYYIFPIWYDAERVGMSRSLFVRSVLAELPEPRGFESTPLAEGYIKPLYLLEMFQQRRAMGRGSFPWAFAPESAPDYSKGLCPVAESMYERELILSPLVREPLSVEDIDDIADAMEKVLGQASEIVAKLGDDQDVTEVVTPIDVANSRGTT